MSDLFMTGIYEQVTRQLKDGKAFVLEAPDHVPSVWGEDADVIWSEGEPLFVVGPQGVGKSTVLQQVALARAGILKPEVLGFPIKADLDRVVLYLASDRPSQIARSLRRMVTAEHAELLATRLRVWRGPLPFDLVREPQRLALLAEGVGAGTVVVDSLKDIAYPLSSDEVGSAVNRAFGTVVAAGIELAAIHHSRKATSDNKKPNTLADVYGSTWLTAGAGSVISLWGEPGDPLIELTHLKQPAEDVGPLELEHDHDFGTTRVRDRQDAWTVLQDAGSEGIAVQDAAVEIYGRKATRSQVEKIRRKLQRLADKGLAIPSKGPSRTDPVVFRAVPSNGTVKPREGSREASRQHHAASRTPGNTDHGSFTHPIDHPVTPLRGAGGQEREAAIDGWTDDELQALIDSQEQSETGGAR
jgi:energy-coupling factor transporter ATP-binding protein EcfA2